MRLGKRERAALREKQAVRLAIKARAKRVDDSVGKYASNSRYWLDGGLVVGRPTVQWDWDKTAARRIKAANRR